MSASAPFCLKAIQIIETLSCSTKGMSYHISKGKKQTSRRGNLLVTTCKLTLEFHLQPHLLTWTSVGTTWRRRGTTLGSIAYQPPYRSFSMIHIEFLSNNSIVRSIHTYDSSLFQICFERVFYHVLLLLSPPPSIAPPVSRFFCTPSRCSSQSCKNPLVRQMAS